MGLRWFTQRSKDRRFDSGSLQSECRWPRYWSPNCPDATPSVCACPLTPFLLVSCCGIYMCSFHPSGSVHTMRRNAALRSLQYLSGERCPSLLPRCHAWFQSICFTVISAMFVKRLLRPFLLLLSGFFGEVLWKCLWCVSTDQCVTELAEMLFRSFHLCNQKESSLTAYLLTLLEINWFCCHTLLYFWALMPHGTVWWQNWNVDGWTFSLPFMSVSNDGNSMFERFYAKIKKN